MSFEVINPAFKVGDAVRIPERHTTGTIAKVYENSGIPVWYGVRRLLHTHCYEVRTARGSIWGMVDAELIRVEEE